MELIIPRGYKKNPNCNGCGTDWNAKLIPDTIYLVSIREACCIHDYMYSVGKTADYKKKADNIFLQNMYKIIENNNKWYYPTFLAKRRARTYYLSVKLFGDGAYWVNKTKEKE